MSLFLQRAEDALGVQTAPLGAPKPPTHEFFAGFSPLRTSLLVATLNNKAALLRLYVLLHALVLVGIRHPVSRFRGMDRQRVSVLFTTKTCGIGVIFFFLARRARVAIK